MNEIIDATHCNDALCEKLCLIYSDLQNKNITISYTTIVNDTFDCFYEEFTKIFNKDTHHELVGTGRTHLDFLLDHIRATKFSLTQEEYDTITSYLTQMDPVPNRHTLHSIRNTNHYASHSIQNTNHYDKILCICDVINTDCIHKTR